MAEPNIEEAERRIAWARRTGAEVLDLGDLALRALPASLCNLSSLKALYLGIIGPTADGKLEWDFERETSELTDLVPLSGLVGLQSLDLYGCGGVTDLVPLSGLGGLQSLSLSFTGVTDLVPLSGLGGLQSLDLRDTGVTDLFPLSGLVGLQSLYLFGCRGVTDLVPLSGLVGLQSLDLFGCRGVTDLVPLSGLVACNN